MTWYSELDRRQFVKTTVATGTVIGVAGCSSIADEVSSAADDSSGSSDTDRRDNNGADGSGDSGGEISVGETVEGTLGRESPTSPYHDSIAVPYTLEVEQRQRVRISHESDAFDTQLVLTNENDDIVERNSGHGDSPGDDSLLMPLLSPDETYTIWAGKDGFVTSPVGFTLSVDGPSALVGDTIDVTFGETITADPDAAVPDPHQKSTLGYDSKVPLRLELDEQRRIHFEAPQVVPTDDRLHPVTEAEAKPRGTYQVVQGDIHIVRNEYTTRARRADEGFVQMSEAGTITLSPGEYLLWTVPGEDVTITDGTIPIEDRVQGAPHLTPGDTVTGDLKQEPPREPYDYLNADPYTIDGEEGQMFSIEISEEEFDHPGLVLSDMDGNAINVKKRRRLKGKLRMYGEIPEDGRYVIWVRAHLLPGATNTGEFTLSVPEITVPEEAQTVTRGETVTGEITEESPRDPVNNDLAVPYVIERNKRTRTQITLESDEIDPKLILTDGTGEERLRSGGTDIRMPAIPEGFVVVWAGSETGFETGSFTLSVEKTD